MIVSDATRAQDIEAQLGLWLRTHVNPNFVNFVLFAVKLGWVSLFGGALLAALIATHFLWDTS